MFLANFISSENFERLSSIAQSSFWPLLEGALKYTIPLSIVIFPIGLIIALAVAMVRIKQVPILSQLARIYVSIIRGTPLLVQLFIIFYGLPMVGLTLDPLPAAVIGFSLSVGAYASETVRAAILSIPKGQWEAAYMLGMTEWQALRRVILPQATRVAVPPLSNAFISLIKDTSLASVLLVTEMFRRAQEIVAVNYEFLLVYSEAALIYWVICFVLSLGQDRLEKRFDRFVAK